MSKKPYFSNTIETRIAGIPCLIGIDHFYVQEPHRGSAFTCDSRDDYYGYTECDFTVLDRKGYVANWLHNKLTPRDEDRIVEEIENYFEKLANDW